MFKAVERNLLPPTLEPVRKNLILLEPANSTKRRLFNFKYKKTTYILVSDGANDVLVVAGVTNKLPLEEGDVQDGRIEVDELEDEHLERQVVVKIRLCSMHL